MIRHRFPLFVLLLGAGVAPACGSAGETEVVVAADAAEDPLAASIPLPDPGCERVGDAIELPGKVRETSGLARSRRDPDIFWTHNDAGNDPVLYALDPAGRLVAEVRVRGASQEDWEDLAVGPCADGECLFVGDIGDNDAERSSVRIYRLPEPDLGAQRSARADELRARYPDGPRDAEALFVLPAGDLYIVTKGRHAPVELYHYPGPPRPDETVTLVRVRQLSLEPDDRRDWVTGASASPDGRWVAIRTYSSLQLFPAAPLVSGEPVDAERIDLTPFAESQGEAVVLEDGGDVWLTSEAGGGDEPAKALHLRCTLPTG